MTTQTDERDEMRAHWNSISAGWLRWHDTFERGGAAVTAKLMELAGIGPGQAVLDVGTGLGDPALTVAEAVGPQGRVLGIDPSDEMIRLARARAGGAARVEFAVVDPDSLVTEERFDAVVSRWCLMLLPDRAATLRTLRGLLRPGGVLAAAVWGPPERAPMIALPFPVLTERLDLPPMPDGESGPYAMADAATCHAELAAAGFTDITVVEQPAPFWFDTAEDYVRFARAILPAGIDEMLRQRYGSADDPGTWGELTRRAAGFTTADGRVDLTSTTLCMRATAPAGG